MTTPSAHRSDNDFTPGAGSSADQHVTGSGEEGDFITDETPTGDTPANGSGNAGVNDTRANRQEPEVDRL